MKNKFEMTREQNIFLAKRNLVDNIYSNANQCVLNLRDTWKYVINNIENDFNLDFICKINELVASYYPNFIAQIKKKKSNSLFSKIVLMGLSFQKIANNRKKI